MQHGHSHDAYISMDKTGGKGGRGDGIYVSHGKIVVTRVPRIVIPLTVKEGSSLLHHNDNDDNDYNDRFNG